MFLYKDEINCEKYFDEIMKIRLKKVLACDKIYLYLFLGEIFLKIHSAKGWEDANNRI